MKKLILLVSLLLFVGCASSIQYVDGRNALDSKTTELKERGCKILSVREGRNYIYEIRYRCRN